MCVCVKKEEGHWFESSLNEQRVTSDPITMLTWSTAGGGNNPGAEATSGNTCSVCLLCEVSEKKIVTFQKHILHLKTLINSSTSLLFVSPLSWPPESCVDRKPNFISLKVRQWRTGPRVMVHLGYGPLGLFLPQGEEGACTGNECDTRTLFNSSGQWWHRRSWYKRKRSPKETFSRFQSALIVRWERFFFLLFVFFHNNK